MFFLKTRIETKIGFLVLLGFFLLVIFLIKSFKFSIPLSEVSLSRSPLPLAKIKKFASLEEFKIYLKETEAIARGWERPGEGMFILPMIKMAPILERVSPTTVQVPGLDEPDIVKTDGKEIYFSPGKIWPIWREGFLPFKLFPPYPYQDLKTKIIKAFPPENLALDSEIEESGDLLLVADNNILVIFSDNAILAYDVSNPKKPEKKWEIKLEKKNSIVASRLYKNKIYFVTKNLIDQVRPCPIEPLIVENKPIIIPCQEIYYLPRPIPVDVTFLAFVLDPLSGQIEKKISFVGSSGQSVVYMSERAIYITYPFLESIVKFFTNFLKEKGKDLVSPWVEEKLEKLVSYDISQEAKILELENILEKYKNSLNDDERLKFENELSNRISNYYKDKKRELEKSQILKIDLEKFEIEAIGDVAGFPLNQFALDEWEGNLRIATTLGRGLDFWGLGVSDLTNDVYILDKDLKIIGSIEDLGLSERIYSVRFINDKGYLVTFRKTDPFFVLDLSNPQKPELKGQLKIPGFSSYLHEITKDKILGIGQENSQVKISIFEVGEPENPKELSKYILSEHWSEVLKTHHAFLLDKKHEIFFVPGSQGAYIFSYQDDQIKLVKAVTGVSVRRALYLNDFLYIITDNKIVVLNEIDWQKINELEF